MKKKVIAYLSVITVMFSMLAGILYPSADQGAVSADAASTRYISSIYAYYSGHPVLPLTSLKKEDFVVTGYYNTGGSEKITDFSFYPMTLYQLGSNTITITYNNGSGVVSTTCTVVCLDSLPDYTYTVSFNSNGGTYVSPIYDVSEGSTIVLPAPPTRTGYWFRGWYTSTSYDTEFTDFTPVTRYTTLYAKWEEKEDKTRDTMTRTVTDGKTTITVKIDLTGQTYGAGVDLKVTALNQSKIERAAASITDSDKYIGFDFNIEDFTYNEKTPLPVMISYPSGYNVQKTGIYYTPDRISTLAQSHNYMVNGYLYFMAYQSGTYILAEQQTDDSSSSNTGKPYIALNDPGSIMVNGQASLYPTMKNFEDDPNDYTFTWKSKNTSIATVDRDGIITGKKPGTTTIVCSTDDNKYSASVSIKVKGTLVKSIKPSVTKKTIVKGKTYQLKVSVSPSNAYKKTLKYTSSKSSIAAVSSKGKITAKKKGTCTITIKTTDGSNLTKKVKVTVK